MLVSPYPQIKSYNCMILQSTDMVNLYISFQHVHNNFVSYSVNTLKLYVSMLSLRLWETMGNYVCPKGPGLLNTDVDAKCADVSLKRSQCDLDLWSPAHKC